MTKTQCDPRNQVTVERGEATGRKAADEVKDDEILAALNYAIGFASRLEERRHTDAQGVLLTVASVEWTDEVGTAINVDTIVQPVGFGDRILYVRGG